MKTYTYKAPKQEHRSAAHKVTAIHTASTKALSITDNSPEAVAQRRVQVLVTHSLQVQQYKPLPSVVNKGQNKGSSLKTIQRVLIDLKQGKDNKRRWIGLQRMAQFSTLRPAANIPLEEM